MGGGGGGWDCCDSGGGRASSDSEGTGDDAAGISLVLGGLEAFGVLTERKGDISGWSTLDREGWMAASEANESVCE